VPARAQGQGCCARAQGDAVTKYWEDTVTPMTNAQMVETCMLNLADAVKEEAMARSRYRVMQPGAAGIADARLDILRHHQDQAHWREYADYYRLRGEREGHDKEVPVPKGMSKPPAPPAPSQAAPRPSPPPPPPPPPADDDEEIPF
jgi:hypothetical protein